MESGRFLTQTRSFVVTLSILASLAVFSGCRTEGGHGELPRGEWRGRGTFVYQQFHDSPEADAKAAGKKVAGQNITRSYDTSLHIERSWLDSREIVRMDIRSKRGDIPSLEGDETHIVAAFVPVRRLENGVRLYKALGMQLNPKPEEKLDAQDDAPPVLATLHERDGVTIFQLNYTDNFSDTFRFAGGKVEKTGTFFDKDEGFVQWAEELSRVK